ncbi:MAG: cytochrome C [Bdellovibrionota bacterium]|nr:MAG: cytochrome C [Bdellovibrionota bacterium]
MEVKSKLLSGLLSGSLLLLGSPAISFGDQHSIEHGRYITLLAGCNDCHTAGYGMNNGNIPESEWLKGDPIGWRGPWGTTYPINLRKLVSGLSKEAWMTLARNSKARPPMPVYTLKAMKEEDLSEMYDYIRSLGDSGEAMPAALPPEKEPTTPYIHFVPVTAKAK